MAVVIASLGQTTTTTAAATITNTTAKVQLRTMPMATSAMAHPVKVNLLLTGCPWEIQAGESSLMSSQIQNPLHGASQPIPTLQWTMALQLGAKANPLRAVEDGVKVLMTPVDLMAEEMHLLDQAPLRKVPNLCKMAGDLEGKRLA